MRIRAIGLAALVLALVGAAIFYKPPGRELEAEREARVLARFDVSDRAAFYAVGGKGGLFIAAKDGARFLTAEGAEGMSDSYTLKSPAVIGNGGVCAVLERGGYSVYVMNQSQRLYSVTEEYPILSASVTPRGYLCLILKDGDSHRLTVYGGGGEPRMSAEFVNKRITPLGAAVSEDGRVLAVSFLDAEEAEVRSFINFYYINRSESVNTSNPDGMFAFSGDRPGELIGAMRFFGGTLVALTDAALLRLEPEKPGFDRLEVPINGKLSAVSLDDKRVSLAFAEGGAEEEPLGRVLIYDERLKLKGQFDAGAAVNSLNNGHGGVVAGTWKAVSVLNAAGAELFNCPATADVKRALLISAGELALCGASEVRVLPIK